MLPGQTRRFWAPIFIDCTGDGRIGYWAGADHRYGRESHNELGESWDQYVDLWSPEKPDNRTKRASVLWNTHRINDTVYFPKAPWAMDVAKDKAALCKKYHTTPRGVYKTYLQELRTLIGYVNEIKRVENN